ncbi:MAG TPA: TRC40/GET3/ArsA family transport-energizing ATPase [Solirubrobacteraceae bacterium]|jgi:arsenite-transporting ATPase
MAPRTILYTGKGGVGKTSVAAASALRCAQAGLRTILVSTDPAHSLSDSLGVELSADPTPIGESLWGQQICAQEELERNWSGVQEWLGDMLVSRGVNRISAAELTVPPGMDELFSLLALKRHHESSSYEVIIVDCAPTGETLRLLAFPDVARWWLERVLPAQGQIMAAARPFARAMLDLSLPGEAVLEDVQRLASNLIALHEILSDHEHVTIRLVMNPEEMVIDEARRTFTYLNLYGYLTDAVIVNRVFPEQVGAYFQSWRCRQQEHLQAVREAFSPVPVLCAPYFQQEVLGTEMLERLGEELFGAHEVAGVLHDRLANELTVSADDAVLRIDLPFARRERISMKKIGAELIIKVDEHKRTIVLPPALAEHRPEPARLVDGALQVRFLAPEPTLAGSGG